MPDNREFRLNNLGELEQFLGGEWIKTQTPKARENDTDTNRTTDTADN